MVNRVINLFVTQRPIAVFIIALLVTACATSNGTPEYNPTISTQPVRFAATPQDDVFSNIPAEVRIATHQGDPRTATYWTLWNTCASENRTDVATANGGREAGWILLDDLLDDPGIQLGDYSVNTCKEGLALIQGLTAIREETNDPIYELAAALLVAELNLNTGAESCPIAEEAVVGGHLVLAQVDFNGVGEYFSVTSSEIASVTSRLAELLTSYNRGELCR